LAFDPRLLANKLVASSVRFLRCQFFRHPTFQTKDFIMRILFTSTGGAGHLQPLLPYARALVQRGHDVRVAAPISVAATLEKAGLMHVVLDNPDGDTVKEVMAGWMPPPRTPRCR
jgi:hypothetical protein